MKRYIIVAKVMANIRYRTYNSFRIISLVLRKQLPQKDVLYQIPILLIHFARDNKGTT